MCLWTAAEENKYNAQNIKYTLERKNKAKSSSITKIEKKTIAPTTTTIIVAKVSTAHNDNDEDTGDINGK